MSLAFCLGAIYSAVCITPERLADLVNAQWVDVCQDRA